MGGADAVGCPEDESNDVLDDDDDEEMSAKRTLRPVDIADGDVSLFSVRICTMREGVRRTVYRGDSGDGGGRGEKSIVSSKLANQVYIVRRFCCSPRTLVTVRVSFAISFREFMPVKSKETKGTGASILQWACSSASASCTARFMHKCGKFIIIRGTRQKCARHSKFGHDRDHCACKQSHFMCQTPSLPLPHVSVRTLRPSRPATCPLADGGARRRALHRTTLSTRVQLTRPLIRAYVLVLRP